MQKQTIQIKKNGKAVFKDIEVARSYGQRMKGLSGRKKLESDGLLLVFPNQSKHSIWMPNMKFPIDIVYIDKAKKVVDIKHCARPLSLNPKTWKVFRPSEKSMYVLEIPANSAKARLKPGDTLQFDIPDAK